MIITQDGVINIKTLAIFLVFWLYMLWLYYKSDIALEKVAINKLSRDFTLNIFYSRENVIKLCLIIHRTSCEKNTSVHFLL